MKSAKKYRQIQKNSNFFSASMFELSVACKYLLPRWRQLSVSIISLISVLVITLVVWLIVVFFSVTDGLEKSWIHKLTALTAPVRIIPTDAYFSSYYYQIDSISEASGYSYKTIFEKNEAVLSNPYDADIDAEIPSFWHPPDLDADGNLKDLVKLAYASIDEIKGVAANDFELTGSQLYLQFTRNNLRSSMNQPTYLGNIDLENPNLNKTILPIRVEDINHYLKMIETKNSTEEDKFQVLSSEDLKNKVNAFFQEIEVQKLKTKASGWIIPKKLIPQDISWKGFAIFKKDILLKIFVPIEAKKIPQTVYHDDPNYTIIKGDLKNGYFHFDSKQISIADIPLVLEGSIPLPAILEKDLIHKIHRIDDLKFKMNFLIQGTNFTGIVPFKGFELGEVIVKNPTFWIHQKEKSYILPNDWKGEGILVPKGFKDTGVMIGDQGYLTYIAPTSSMIQEHRLPVFVAGFYDPGIIPLGAKFVFANRDVISTIRGHYSADNRMTTNGINIRFDDFDRAEEVKKQLLESFKKKGIHRYWDIQTYREYEFTKEIMQELQSQKSIFSVIAVVIILVACSNIISMLIILVNDKKVEIGILRSMGASSKSIAFIFGLAGGVIGILGSVLGIGAAILTIKNLQTLVNMVSVFQGRDLFNTAFYGESIPQELSYEALSFVLIATVLISLLAGIVPAIKACLLKPSTILRSTG